MHRTLSLACSNGRNARLLFDVDVQSADKGSGAAPSHFHLHHLFLLEMLSPDPSPRFARQ